jgi:hypothetical protein
MVVLPTRRAASSFHRNAAAHDAIARCRLHVGTRFERPPEGACSSRKGNSGKQSGKTRRAEHIHCRHQPIRTASRQAARNHVARATPSQLAHSAYRSILAYPPKTLAPSTKHALRRFCVAALRQKFDRTQSSARRRGSGGLERLTNRAGGRPTRIRGDGLGSCEVRRVNAVERPAEP